MPTPPSDNPDDYSGTPAPGSLQIKVPLDMAGERLDVVLAKLLPEHSRSRLQNWIREGRVLRQAEVLDDPKLRLLGNDSLLINEGQACAAPLVHAAQDMALDVIYEDEHVMVINKPVGLVVHPGNGNWDGTLLNGLLAHEEELAELPRAGIVHRLDKDTSGLLVIAKTAIAQTDLVRQLQARSVKRQYMAIVMGDPLSEGTLDAPIGRHPVHRTRMAVSAIGKEARTHYRVLEYFQGAACVECSLETGRTHQIRVHMAHLGHPLIGDSVYAARRRPPKVATYFPRQALHAYRLGLVHPATGKSMHWEVPVPEDMQELMQRLRESADA